MHQNFPSQGLPKYTKMEFFGMKIHYLATLNGGGILLEREQVEFAPELIFLSSKS
jgi:hypothetical protein